MIGLRWVRADVDISTDPLQNGGDGGGGSGVPFDPMLEQNVLRPPDNRPSGAALVEDDFDL